MSYAIERLSVKPGLTEFCIADNSAMLAPLDHSMPFDSLSQEVLDMQWLDKDEDWQNLLAMIDSPTAQPVDTVFTPIPLDTEIKVSFPSDSKQSILRKVWLPGTEMQMLAPMLMDQTRS